MDRPISHEQISILERAKVTTLDKWAHLASRTIIDRDHLVPHSLTPEAKCSAVP